MSAEGDRVESALEGVTQAWPQGFDIQSLHHHVKHYDRLYVLGHVWNRLLHLSGREMISE